MACLVIVAAAECASTAGALDYFCLKIKDSRLYIKHHFRYPLVNQSVAAFYATDGLDFRTKPLTVNTSIAF